MPAIAARHRSSRIAPPWQPWRYRFASDMLRIYRRATEVTRAGGVVRLHWCGPELDHAGWQNEFRRALHRRINLKSAPYPSGRKYDDEWQIHMRRDRNRLVDIASRVRVYQFETPEIRRRFGHLLAHYDD